MDWMGNAADLTCDAPLCTPTGVLTCDTALRIPTGVPTWLVMQPCSDLWVQTWDQLVRVSSGFVKPSMTVQDLSNCPWQFKTCQTVHDRSGLVKLSMTVQDLSNCPWQLDQDLSNCPWQLVQDLSNCPWPGIRELTIQPAIGYPVCAQLQQSSFCLLRSDFLFASTGTVSRLPLLWATGLACREEDRKAKCQ